MWEIIGIIIAAIGGYIVALFTGKKPKEDNSPYIEPMDYQMRYDTLKRIEEQKVKEKTDELEGKDMDSLHTEFNRELSRFSKRKGRGDSGTRDSFPTTGE